jgi:outer membrane protein, heavy metal efflux system
MTVASTPKLVVHQRRGEPACTIAGMRPRRSILIVLLLALAAPALRAQRLLSRRDAIETALARGPVSALIAADTARAAAAVSAASVRFQPNLQASYTESSPQYHVIGELPLEGLLLRGSRLTVARAAQQSARRQFAFNRASLRYDVDTAYTRALAASVRALLSQRNALDADSLRRIAERRRDAGDASELDVQLATISAGQQANIAERDSVAAINSLLDVQMLLGEPADSVRIALAETLGPPEGARGLASTGVPLRVATATSSLTAAVGQVALEKRSRFGVPALTVGVEQGDPSGAQTYALPTIGIALPIPFPGRNKSAIQAADAERGRAVAALAVAVLESQRQIARATRERAAAEQRVARDGRLLASAERVATLGLIAYREGASSLPNVLEARRSARDVMAQYIDDLAALWIAIATQTLVSLTERP